MHIALAIVAAMAVAGSGLVGGPAFGETETPAFPPFTGIGEPGTNFYPQGGQRLLPHTLHNPVDRTFAVSLLDSYNGYLYLVTPGSRPGLAPGKVSKFRLSPDKTAIERVSELVLDRVDNTITTGAIDPVNGYAYFPMYDYLAYEEVYESAYYETFQIDQYRYNGKSHLLKVALGEGDAAPRRVDAFDLHFTLVHTRMARYHPGLNKVYFAVTNRPQKILEFDAGDGDGPLVSERSFSFSSLSSLLHLRDIAIDTVHDHLYVSLSNLPHAEMRKYSLAPGASTRDPVATFQLEGPFAAADESLVDTVRERIYFRNGAHVGVYELTPGDEPPAFIGSFELPSTSDWLDTSNFDTANRWLIVPAPRPDASLGAAFAVYDLDGSPETDDPIVFQLGPGETHLRHRAWDPVQQVFYVMLSARNNNPAKLVAYDLSNGPEAPQRLAELTLESGYNNLSAFIRDDATGYMYAANHEGPPHLLKFAFDPASERIEEVGSMATGWPDGTVSSGLADSGRGYAYFTLNVEDTRFLKVAMTEGDSPPELVADIPLPPNESGFVLRALDATRGHAYLSGTYANRPHLVKVALGAGDAPPHRILGGPVGEPDQQLRRVSIDESSGLAYLSMTRPDEPATVSKHFIGIEDQPPLFLGSLRLEADEQRASFSLLDTTGTYLYIGSGDGSGTRTVKLRTGGTSQPLARLGATAGPGRTSITFGHMDHQANHVWFGSVGHWRYLYRMNLGLADALPTRVGGPTLPMHDFVNAGAVFDFENGLAHVHTGNPESHLFSMTISHKHHVMGNRVTLPEDGEAMGLRFYSHHPHGKLRFAVYSGSESPELLWESGLIENTVADDWLIVPLTQGSPDQLTLPAGDYWLAWQSDSNSAVAGYHRGEVGTGFRWRRPWGPFPAAVPLDEEHDALERNRENWAVHLVYNSDEHWTESPIAEEEEVYEPPLYHDADTNQDNSISFGELLRVVQLFNASEFHCSPLTEDGYAPGPGPRECRYHSADTDQDWNLSLSELLRCIHLYRFESYFRCETSLDGYCTPPGSLWQWF